MVKIFFDIDVKYNFDFDIVRLTKKIANAVLEYENVNYDISFSLSIITEKAMKNLNFKERSINKSTDVLSFPNISFDSPGNFKQFLNKNKFDVSILDLNTKTVFLGDVVICNNVMQKQSKLYGHSLKREFSFLLVHSLLHLLGYDHIEEFDEGVMFNKQNNILKFLNINR